MRTVRFRMVGDDRVEEVADQMHPRDDASSLGLPEDDGPDFHSIEVHVLDAKTAQEVHDRVELAARELDAAVEFVDEF